MRGMSLTFLSAWAVEYSALYSIGVTASPRPRSRSHLPQREKERERSAGGGRGMRWEDAQWEWGRWWSHRCAP